MSRQAAKRIMMMRPKHFGFDPATASSNSFQSEEGAEQRAMIEGLAQIEFDAAVAKLKAEGIDIIALNDTDSPEKPNAVFPNNWVSFHEDGMVLLYPMLTESRRVERRQEVLDELEAQGVEITRIIDISHYENEGKFLESTGSVVLDYGNKLAYACLSSRTHIEVLEKFCEILDYEPVVFESMNIEGQAIYHTNVVMCIADQYAVICSESIPQTQRVEVLAALKNTGHGLVEITMEQMYNFAGNMLEVMNDKGQSVLVMSESAMKSLTIDQKETLSSYSKLVAVAIPTIEKFGGGSVRCMMCKLS
ncbi:MAG: amidinotransferase [Cytophagales bacterium CG12_big_fil_rev_8_21_14_0_65_40_12]|nr:MAG: amidinotransferase [Cytophagales bacterium CG12_big_fil_rev_8_21_14_0_65_40_12]PIW03363.1 MAG: amidinotransferase [Cytophagales bacterium CG17_big_fil_post_rev_8_21_14_2_50_40_13]